ncbi:Ig-like domain-containing protein [Leeuwenhoekiella sp. MAR_2009_132]|nr:Ig-like domain-containing protein [Leeuwenhoekiella sp. MAR_2009_132]
MVTQPTNGTLVFNPDGSYTYTPNADFIGEDTFAYQYVMQVFHRLVTVQM